jgi:hypothetical protein
MACEQQPFYFRDLLLAAFDFESCGDACTVLGNLLELPAVFG